MSVSNGRSRRPLDTSGRDRMSVSNGRSRRPLDTSGPDRQDRGSASIWLLCAGSVVIAFGLAGALAAAAATARHRAQTAADLGAVAGARYAVAGEAVACARASMIVEANGARMTGCRLDGFDLTVDVELPVAGLGTVHGTARAGPVGESLGRPAGRLPRALAPRPAVLGGAAWQSRTRPMSVLVV
jgi:secretion/DNA translocation related TadE-like protein